MTAAAVGRGAAIPLDSVAWCTASAAAAVLALGLQARFGINPDTSWLLGVAERTLDGAVPYRDILETNPPASFLLYVPAVSLGRALGGTPEAVTDALVIVGFALSAALGGAILRCAALLDANRAPALLFATTVVLLVLPVSSFAQREHIALLASLPALAALAGRAAGRPPALSHAMLAGLGAGAAIAIKPIFALAFAGPLLCCPEVRSWRRILSPVELWVGMAVALSYGALVLLSYPEFATRMLPLLAVVYVPARRDALDLLMSPTMEQWLLLAAAFVLMERLRRDTSADPWGRALVLASAGYAAAFFIQGKGFKYHGYPAVAAASLACAAIVLRGPPASPSAGWPAAAAAWIGAVAVLAGVAVFDEHHDRETEMPGLSRAILSLNPHPRILGIGQSMYVARAYAREIGAEAIGSSPMAWVTIFARWIAPDPARDPRFAEPIRAEQERFAAEIAGARPDAVVVDGDAWVGWIDGSPALTAALAPYRRVGRFGKEILFARADDAAATVREGQGWEAGR